MAQAMACCLTAPSHYLNQCWLIIRRVLWHSSDNNFTGSTYGMNSWNVFENNISKITVTSTRVKWVKLMYHNKPDITNLLPCYTYILSIDNVSEFWILSCYILYVLLTYTEIVLEVFLLGMYRCNLQYILSAIRKWKFYKIDWIR